MRQEVRRLTSELAEVLQVGRGSDEAATSRDVAAALSQLAASRARQSITNLEDVLKSVGNLEPSSSGEEVSLEAQALVVENKKLRCGSLPLECLQAVKCFMLLESLRTHVGSAQYAVLENKKMRSGVLCCWNASGDMSAVRSTL